MSLSIQISRALKRVEASNKPAPHRRVRASEDNTQKFDGAQYESGELKKSDVEKFVESELKKIGCRVVYKDSNGDAGTSARYVVDSSDAQALCKLSNSFVNMDVDRKELNGGHDSECTVSSKEDGVLTLYMNTVYGTVVISAG